MFFVKTTTYVSFLLLCGTVTLAPTHRASSEQNTPSVPKEVMEFFSEYSDAEANHKYIPAEEMHEILSKYPVFCDGNNGLRECYEVTFDSKTTGTIRGQNELSSGVQARAYLDGPLQLTDNGLCIKPKDIETQIRITDEDSNNKGSIANFLRAYLYAYDNYVETDCLRFSYIDGKNSESSTYNLNQFESFNLIDGTWKYSHKPKKTEFSKTWKMEQAGFTATKLTASHASKDDQFGATVAFSGNTAIVGAPWNDNKQGAVYVYDVSTGTQTAILTADNAVDGLGFGTSVALSEATVVVGAFGDPKTNVSGGAYFFDSTTGKQTAYFTPDKGSENDSRPALINSVGISGSVAIVGVGGVMDGTNAAYLVDAKTGAQLAKLTAGDGPNKGWFGRSVAISGTTAVVGAPAEDHGRGAAYVFDTKEGTQLGKLVANDRSKEGGAFGASVAISGTTVIVGAVSQDDYRGAAYLFESASGKQITKLTAGYTAPIGFFGNSVAISGTTAIVGAMGYEKIGGSAFLFDTTKGAQISWLSAGNTNVNRRFGTAVAISGTSAIVGVNTGDKDDGASGFAYLFKRH